MASVARSRLTEGEVHDVLRNERRRNVIRELHSRIDEMTLRALAERIAAIEAGESPAPRNVRDSVYNSLHQTHLPKLDDLGVVIYDRNRKTVELDGSARQVYLHMEVLTPYGLTWAEYYRTLALIALVTVIASASELFVFASLDVRLVASSFLLLIAVSTAYQLWTQRWVILRGFIH